MGEVVKSTRKKGQVWARIQASHGEEGSLAPSVEKMVIHSIPETSHIVKLIYDD